MWEMIKSDIPSEQKSRDLLEMDKILGLGLDKYLGIALDVPKEVKKLVDEREKARKSGDFKSSDKLRNEINKFGYEVEDTSAGAVVKNKN